MWYDIVSYWVIKTHQEGYQARKYLRQTSR